MVLPSKTIWHKTLALLCCITTTSLYTSEEPHPYEASLRKGTEAITIQNKFSEPINITAWYKPIPNESIITLPIAPGETKRIPRYHEKKLYHPLNMILIRGTIFHENIKHQCLANLLKIIITKDGDLKPRYASHTLYE